MIKLTAILILGCCLQLSATTYGQQVTISKKNASLKDILVDVYKQTGYYFYGSSELLEKAKPVTISVKNGTLEKVLHLCFLDQSLEYKIEDRTILITEKMILKTVQLPSFADVRGKVTNDKGEPLEGASITVKGTIHSVKTNATGDFIMQGLDQDAVLIISNIGYESVEVKPGTSHDLHISLVVSVNKLDEVQVIAYGTVTRRFNTGDVSTVKGEDIAKQPVTNPINALEGRVAGLVVSQTSGLAGSFVNVQIRGQNSLRNQLTNNGNYPLYIIDGIPFPSEALNSRLQIGKIGTISPLNSINPADIESIEILKDADATAIYGSRGSNGVIIITTKKAKSGKAETNISVIQGAGKVTRMMNLLNTRQYLEMRHEAYANDIETPGIADAPDLLLWDTTRNTDWQKTIFGGTSHSTDVRGSVTGGNENNQFMLGGSYHRESTVYPGDFLYKRASAHFNISHNSTDHKLKFSLSGSYLDDNNNLPYQQMVLAALVTPPDAPPIYDSTGRFNYNNSYYNLFNDLGNTYLSKSNNLVGNFTLSYLLGAGFSFHANLGYNYFTLEEQQLIPAKTQDPAYSPQAVSLLANNGLSSWIAEPQLNWNKSFKQSRIELVAGLTFQQSVKNGLVEQGSGYSSDLLIQSLAAAPSIAVMDNYRIDYKYDAIFARINYNIRDKYLINLTGRRDGSSRFGPGKQFANFGAVGAAWIFSKESFIEKNLPFLSFGKMRGSYGITGSDQIPDYGFLSTYSAISFYPYQGSAVLQPSRLFNPEFSWETNRKAEIALELGFFKNRLLLNTSFFRNRSSNQLVGYSLPVITGFTSIQNNLPATVQNTGLEIELNSINIRHNNFSWSSSLNLTLPANKLVSYPNITGSTYSTTYSVGQPLSIQYKYQYAGVDPQTGVYQFQDVKAGSPTTDPLYPDDLRPLKKIAIAFFGGFQNAFRFKNWQLDFLWQFVKQTGKNYEYGFSDYSPGMMANQPSRILQRWRKPGDITDVQQFTQDYGTQAYSSFSNYANYGDHTIVDASFLRLKNISLSYQVPLDWMNKAKINNAKIFIQCQDLITITRYIGFDPENQSISNLPPVKMITAGFQIIF